jgi:hypothetical protein
MGGGAFLLLKAGDFRPESSKQAEIRLANLLKILRNLGSGGQYPPMTATGPTTRPRFANEGDDV